MPKPTGATIQGKIRYWLKQQRAWTEFTVKDLRNQVFDYRVTPQAVRVALPNLKANGLVGRDGYKGNQKRWYVTKLGGRDEIG